MNAKQCAALAREHYAAGTKDMALDWLIDAVVKLAGAKEAETAIAPIVLQLKMTAEDAAVYAEAMKALALLRAKYGAVAL